MVSNRTRERPRWQRVAGGLLVGGSLAYGIAATFGGWAPATQIDEYQRGLVGESDVYYTLVLTWFVLLLPGAALLTAAAVVWGGRDAAKREATIARATVDDGARYYRGRFERFWSRAHSVFRRRQ